MKISKISTSFDEDVTTVWSLMIDNENYTWRSDLSKIEIVDETHFIEYNKKNVPTYFTITEKRECKLYQFTMENKYLTGTWQGRFYPGPQKETCVEFIEELTFKNLLYKCMGMLRNVKKMQETYIHDLHTALIDRKERNHHG